MSDDEPLVQLRLSPRPAPRLWRDADEYAQPQPPALGELPPDATAAPAGWSRRAFLQLAGASLGLASLDGCDRTVPREIVPYSLQPRDVQAGVPRRYATAMMLDGFATGLLVESHEGRPTKIEGNPEHPASLGATGPWEQALVLSLYDPDRGRQVLHAGQPSSWEALLERLRQPRGDDGRGLRLLLEPTTSPTTLRLLAAVRALHPRLKATFHAPTSPLAQTLAGATLALGRPLQPLYDVAAADVLLVLDADLLGDMPFGLRHARQWAQRRRVASPADTPNRMYAVECAPSVTGMSADHRLRRRAAEIGAVARAIAARLPGIAAPLAAAASGAADPFVAAVVRDLASRPAGTTLVVVGERQPPAVHALGWAMNAALGNLDRTVRALPPLISDGDQDLGALVADMRAGQVDTLVILDANPSYDAPADLDFDRALAAVAERIHVGAYENETARACSWYAPSAHPLESWGDGRAYDGTLSLIQPLIRPLHGARTVSEILAALAGDRTPDARRLLLETHGAALDVDAALQRGLVPGSAASPVPVALADARAIAAALGAIEPAAAAAWAIEFQRSPTVHDGRFANNAWLLEQPTPIGKLTWDNAVQLSAASAARLGVHTQDLVEIVADGRRVRGPVQVTPGHADGAFTLTLGFGRSGAESLARGRGYDAYRLRTTRTLAWGAGQVHRVAGTHELATTQRHFDLNGRPIALTATLAEYRQDPDFTAEHRRPQPSLMPPWSYQGVQWAMSIDLSICTGCSACMLACQAENNVPVVGKESVLKRRQMHWLRIDTYHHGSFDDPRLVHQPMLCQHCETAPCEYVCPVNATVHSTDGLNEMVYNRCVGTRFCSNNCPYKVRRFNWFNWYERMPANEGLATAQHNPDVTTRDRGVMEKCTYCVQRIRRAEIRARIEERPLRPGEVVTACQQACPTGAIQFGSLSHPDTPMVRWRQEPRAYAALDDQGTRPRTLYLARIDNPNPELAK